MSVTKRNGKTEPFQATKIERAIKLAGGTDGLAILVANQVPDQDWHVDELHDFVERRLMANDPDTARRYILYRNRKRAVPDAIADYIHAAKYARFDPALGRRELYHESVARLKKMYEDDGFGGFDLNFAFERVLERRVLPSMRSLQFGGQPIRDHNARMFNCSFTRINRLSAFNEILYLLLCGCGVGFSVQKHHVAQLPRMQKPGQVVFHRVGDTIEGWADAIKHLFSCYATGLYPEFDYSAIRPEGSPLKSSGGLAPGHLPLKKAIESCRKVLESTSELRPIHVMDCICFIADCVRAGGIRRSSLACLFSPDDIEVMTAKTGDWFSANPQRAMSNNSAVFLRDEVDFSDLKRVIQSTKEFGEPGFFFTDSLEHGTNPCYEIGLDPPPNGFGFCNLSEINMAKVESIEDFHDAVRAATILGTLQSAYSNIGYIEAHNAAEDGLLGVSLTGIVDCPIKLAPIDLIRGAELARQVNANLAAKLELARAKRITCIKPSGTASLLLGCVGSGIHPHHAKRYIRRVTAGPNEPVFKFFRQFNPGMCVRKPNGDWVIEFPVETQGTTRSELTDIQFLEMIRDYQRYWVKPGSRVAPFHNVSCTVSVKDWDAVTDFIYTHRNELTAVSLLPDDGDQIYEFAPREAVEEFTVKYHPVDYSLMREHGDSTSITNACEGPSCEL